MSLGTLLDPSRLSALEEILRVEDREHEFDRLARMAARALDVPTCLITLVGASEQHFRGLCGGSAAMEKKRGGPHANSLCRYTVIKGAPVRITHASANPEFMDNPIIRENGIEAYLSIPLENVEGHIFGAICGIDYHQRDWTDEEFALLGDYAAVVSAQLEAVALNERMGAAMDVALHDLKTPLSGLTMASSLVREKMDAIPQELHPLIGVVQSSTEAAVKLVDLLSARRRR